jgi:subtilisin family serine protease
MSDASSEFDPESLSARTGTGVRIALIDSGVNPAHSHVDPIAGGVAFGTGLNGEVLQTSDYRDTLGHGTALAGILKIQGARGGDVRRQGFHRPPCHLD